MAATTDETDREMSKRLQNFFRNNPEFAKDYFRGGTHGGTSSPVGINDHARHLEAVAHVQDLLAKEEAARRSVGVQPASSSVAIERQIRETMDDPSYGDAKHKDHGATIDRLSHLYRVLSATK